MINSNQINSNQIQKDPFEGLNFNQDLDMENPRSLIKKELSNKPNEGDPKSNIKLINERKKMVEYRRKL